MDTAEHFNEIAHTYDYWKKKNWYYYQNIKALVRAHIPAGERTLEIGCGTGDLIADIKPSQGIGLDVSVEMVNIASLKHPGIEFIAGDVSILEGRDLFDYVLIIDVLEHVEDLDQLFRDLRKVVSKNSNILVSVANPSWEPILMLAEKFKMKMPEGPHWRLSIKKNEEFFKKNGFAIVEKGTRLIVPKKIPGSDWLNRRFYKVPIIAQFGAVVYWVLSLEY